MLSEKNSLPPSFRPRALKMLLATAAALLVPHASASTMPAPALSSISSMSTPTPFVSNSFLPSKLHKLRGGGLAPKARASNVFFDEVDFPPTWEHYSSPSAYASKLLDTTVQLTSIALAFKVVGWVWTVTCAGLEVIGTPGRIFPFIAATLKLKRAQKIANAKEAALVDLEDRQDMLKLLAEKADTTPAVREEAAANKQRVLAAQAECEMARDELQAAVARVTKTKYGEEA